MFKIKIADKIFEIRNKYPFIENICTDYLCDGIADKTITVTDSQIEKENTVNISDKGYLESLAIYRKIAEYLLDYDCLLFHSSALKCDDKAYLFTGPSGTGKSTHTALWKKRFGDRVVIINDDKPILKFEDEISVYGTPYAGKENKQSNEKCKVCAIIVLKQAKSNCIRILTKKEAYPLLLGSAYHSKKSGMLDKTLLMVNRLAELPVFCLNCDTSENAVEVAFNALKGLKNEI